VAIFFLLSIFFYGIVLFGFGLILKNKYIASDPNQSF